MTKAQHRSKSDLAPEILRRYTTVELLEMARRELRPYAEKASYLTDEDFFRDFS